jgi:hypothetical protein
MISETVNWNVSSDVGYSINIRVKWAYISAFFFWSSKRFHKLSTWVRKRFTTEAHTPCFSKSYTNCKRSQTYESVLVNLWSKSGAQCDRVLFGHTLCSPCAIIMGWEEIHLSYLHSHAQINLVAYTNEQFNWCVSTDSNTKNYLWLPHFKHCHIQCLSPELYSTRKSAHIVKFCRKDFYDTENRK